jgi:hypothetical protein
MAFCTDYNINILLVICKIVKDMKEELSNVFNKAEQLVWEDME